MLCLLDDEPTYGSPNISTPPNMDRLAPLHGYSDRVVVIPRQPLEAVPDGPLVLGMDAGSTTTKAVLLDRSTRRVVASCYTRTRGDPVAAARDCLEALVDQMGNRGVDLVGTTGSARELVGAYLGTAHVYNEISAHAAGAAHFDPEVDTIFEIGGQDSKYILLRNGVPVDYAMNNACSAGTGSFLRRVPKATWESRCLRLPISRWPRHPQFSSRPRARPSSIRIFASPNSKAARGTTSSPAWSTRSQPTTCRA